jgi:hypothetical protein
MIRKRVVHDDPPPIALSRRAEIAFRILLFSVVGFLSYHLLYAFNCVDGCGPYHNSTSVVDLDGDGDLDVVLSNLRHETETIIWAGATLWINQGGGEFTPRRGDFGGPYMTAGDVDGDGDVDLVRLANDALQIHLNYGEQDRLRGDFRVWFGITPNEDLSYLGSHGSILLGDLNNNGRLDAFVGGCCGVLAKENGVQHYYLSLAWVWINTPDENNNLIRRGQSLSALGDLPMRPALGDLDGDGDLDVYAAIQPPKKGGSYVSADRVLLNDGSGYFRDSGQRLAEGGRLSNNSAGFYVSLRGTVGRWAGNAAGSTAVALGDLDGDGDLDALVGKTSGAAVWINQGGAQGGQAGIFAGPGQRIPGDPTEAVFLADLNSDGHLDALVAGKSRAAIWWNDGWAAFRDSGQRLRYTERHGLAIGDFNGDGYLDVFSAAYDTEFHLWLNQGDGRLQEGN